eukprot:TRINITY_DN9271_c0_g1_i3.p1 TRINITY_DN9271_c0_g1~~TRINITY_DN9271_c0_g1_i3.p1  ORF type:complete len:114 (+),score=28.31 TRINITY_DN9271_c0_g1_i3:113-454(+)
MQRLDETEAVQPNAQEGPDVEVNLEEAPVGPLNPDMNKLPEDVDAEALEDDAAKRASKVKRKSRKKREESESESAGTAGTRDSTTEGDENGDKKAKKKVKKKEKVPLPDWPED